MRLHGEQLTLAAGGHPLPLRIGARCGVTEVGEYGPLLGALPDVHWHDFDFQAAARASTLVAYTDGITDARGEGGERFGLDRLSLDARRASAAGRPSR